MDTLPRIRVAPAVMVFVIISLLHMRLGMQVIIEDYIHHKGWKVPLLYQVATRSSLPQPFPNRFGVHSGGIAISPVSSTTKPDP